MNYTDLKYDGITEGSGCDWIVYFSSGDIKVEVGCDNRGNTEWMSWNHADDNEAIFLKEELSTVYDLPEAFFIKWDGVVLPARQLYIMFKNAVEDIIPEWINSDDDGETLRGMKV